MALGITINPADSSVIFKGVRYDSMDHFFRVWSFMVMDTFDMLLTIADADSK